MVSHENGLKWLQGNKIVLREKNIADASNDYAWATDRELMRLDAGEICRIDFLTYLMEYPHVLAAPNKIQFAVETLDGEHIGNCTCYNIDVGHKEAELGIIIGKREYWGKGYGSDTVRTMMWHIFQELGAKRIFLHTLEWNIRARECFDRCGFMVCGHIVRQGQEFIKMEALAPAMLNQID